MDKPDIRDLSREELGRRIEKMGAGAYRAGQMFKWLYKAGVRSFDETTDIPALLRARLKEEFTIGRMTILDSKRSAIDGTAKYLVKLHDANTIETVFLPGAGHATACLSTQVGCKYGCLFCASAPMGFKRNLAPSEITGQALVSRRENPATGITNLVFMGIGEPLDNYDNVLAAVKIFNDKGAFCIGARKMTISTCGLIPGIERLSGEGLQVELSVSLHAASDALRSRIVPVNKKYPLKGLMAACRNYIKKTGRMITFEYVLIEGVNNSRDDASALAKLLKGMNCKVNTISCNKTGRYDRSASTGKDAGIFNLTLARMGIKAVRRRPKGEDIDAGCGQLRISRMAKA